MRGVEVERLFVILYIGIYIKTGGRMQANLLGHWEKQWSAGRGAFCVGGKMGKGGKGEDELGDGRRTLYSGQKVLLNGVERAGI
jgi:hypothetical protein